MSAGRVELLVVLARTLVISPTEILERGALFVDLGTGFVLAHAGGDSADAVADALEALPATPSGSREAVPGSLPEWLRSKLPRPTTTDAVATAIVSLSVVRHGGVVLPGFVDIHTHGVGGSRDVLKYWHVPDFSRDRYARAGTTSLLASVVFDEANLDVSFESCAALRARARTWRDGRGAVIEGIHAEGPVVATLGGLPESGALAAESDEWFDAFVKRVGGPERALRMMTISPSCDAPRGYARIRALCRAGVVPALGHDKECTEDQVLGALRVGVEEEEEEEREGEAREEEGEEEGEEVGEAGQAGEGGQEGGGYPPQRTGPPARPRRPGRVRGKFHLTHGFNVQVFHHRDCGLANFVAVGAFPRLPRYEGVPLPTVELIGDGMHLAPLIIQAVAGARQSEDWCMVTDAISEPVPGKELTYAGSRVARVSNDGRCVECCDLNDPTVIKLCGSSTTMFENFRKCRGQFGMSLADAVQVCCTAPARIARIDHLAGSLQPGRRANFLLLDDHRVTPEDERAGGGGAGAEAGGGGGGGEGGAGGGGGGGGGRGGTAAASADAHIDLEQVWIAGSLYFLRQQAL